MFQKLSKKLRKKQGFTLIELIVVLAILGIILAIAVPNYLGVQDSAALKADNSALKLIEDGVKLWSSVTPGDETNTYTMAFGSATLTADGADTVITEYLEPISEPTSSTYTGADHVVVTVTVATGVVTANYVNADGATLPLPAAE